MLLYFKKRKNTLNLFTYIFIFIYNKKFIILITPRFFPTFCTEKNYYLTLSFMYEMHAKNRFKSPLDNIRQLNF
jgi:hypothetical protein